MFFINQPEVFQTINFISGLEYKKIPFLLIIGGIFIFSAIIIFLLARKKEGMGENLKNYFLVLLIFFWMPIYINFLYNNFLDFKENIYVYKGDVKERQKIRLCNIDQNQNSGGKWCNIFSFLDSIDKNIPHGSAISVVKNPYFSPYFDYFLYPDYKIISSIARANYIVFYYPQDRFFITTQGVLIKVLNGRETKIGKFKILDILNNPNEIILKRLD